MKDKKMFYVFITCVFLSIVIVGATYAFFIAGSSVDNVVKGESNFTNFSLNVSKVTSLDLTFGLVPMKNIEAPYAAEQLCYDDNKKIGCQIYKITLENNSDNSIIVDGYITTNPIDGIETRYTRVYPKDVNYTDSVTGQPAVAHVFGTNFTKEDMLDASFVERNYIKTGSMVSSDYSQLNREDDYDSLFVSGEEIGGVNRTVDFYVMMWIWDDDTNQSFAQRNQVVYTGLVTFMSSSGSQIKASFD